MVYSLALYLHNTEQSYWLNVHPIINVMIMQKAIITGATNGIGKETALALAKKGYHIIITARSNAKATQTVSEIMAAVPTASVDYVTMELNNLQSVRDAAKAILDKHAEIHVLVNNAGTWERERSLTKDGFETTFQVNHLAPVLFTNLLKPALTAAEEARVVNVSSGLHKRAYINWDDLQTSKKWSHLHAYGQSKLANALFTLQLAEKWKSLDITVNSLEPGVVATRLFDKLPKVFIAVFKLFLKSPKEGAETSVFLASSPDVANSTGLHFKDSKLDSYGKAVTQNSAQKLWDRTNNLLGLTDADW